MDRNELQEVLLPEADTRDLQVDVFYEGDPSAFHHLSQKDRDLRYRYQENIYNKKKTNIINKNTKNSHFIEHMRRSFREYFIPKTNNDNV